jgi:hypothetical protein
MPGDLLVLENSPADQADGSVQYVIFSAKEIKSGQKDSEDGEDDEPGFDLRKPRHVPALQRTD